MKDLVSQIIAYEAGELDKQATITFFQDLIDAGLAWMLQGSYGRAASALIAKGLCHERVG